MRVEMFDRPAEGRARMARLHAKARKLSEQVEVAKQAFDGAMRACLDDVKAFERKATRP